MTLKINFTIFSIFVFFIFCPLSTPFFYNSILYRDCVFFITNYFLHINPNHKCAKHWNIFAIHHPSFSDSSIESHFNSYVVHWYMLFNVYITHTFARMANAASTNLLLFRAKIYRVRMYEFRIRSLTEPERLLHLCHIHIHTCTVHTHRHTLTIYPFVHTSTCTPYVSPIALSTIRHAPIQPLYCTVPHVQYTYIS